MALRKVVHIAEEKCNGCGACIPNCPEGALRIVDGKARLVSDRYCDGLGACLGICPEDAITVIEREAGEFDEQAVAAMQRAERQGGAHQAVHGTGCPGAPLVNLWQSEERAPAAEGRGASALSQWPVQLHLVPTNAPFLQGADLLLAADCVPFAMADSHGRLLRGRKLLIGCPKLDDSAFYAEKLADIFRQNEVKSLTVAHMEVPCCFGLMALARRAVAESGRPVPVEEVIVSVRGEVKEPHTPAAPRG